MLKEEEALSKLTKLLASGVFAFASTQALSGTNDWLQSSIYEQCKCEGDICSSPVKIHTTPTFKNIVSEPYAQSAELRMVVEIVLRNMAADCFRANHKFPNSDFEIYFDEEVLVERNATLSADDYKLTEFAPTAR